MDVGGDLYTGPSEFAAVFGISHTGIRAGKGTIVGPVTKSTHWAEFWVRDAEGALVVAYSLRSGSMTPEEKALGFPNSVQASHTEARGVAMSGGSRTVHIPHDQYANLAVVPRGSTVTVRAILPPCRQCQGSMSRAAKEKDATFVYIWNGPKGSGKWSSEE